MHGLGVFLATNKEKLLESAQKNLKKKQVAKAIKDYAKIVELEPGDIRSRQKLAELYVRTNKTAEAYEQYESVAKYYSSNGFHLKAIAIYKQMQRLDPSQVSIYNRLAELNEKQGLVGNALAEYRSLVDYYERNQLIADEIKTLEKMRDLDPNNLNVRVKLAEVLAKNDRKDEGLNELLAILDVLNDKGEFDKSLKLYTMFLPHYPGNKELQLGLSQTFYEKGDFTRGVTILETLLKEKPEDPDMLRLLGRGCARSGNYFRAVEIFRQLLRMDPTDLDIREALIQCEIDNNHPELGLNELEEWKDAFFKAGRLESLRSFYELLNSELPKNTTILQTLDSIYELTGEGDKLLDIISSRDDTTETLPSEEFLSDSLLGSVDLDIDNGEEISTADDPYAYGVLEDENIDLMLEVDDESSDDEEEVAAAAVIELDISSDFDLSEDSNDLDTVFNFDAENEAPVEQQRTAENLKADLEEAEFYLQQGLFADAERLCRDILAHAPDSQECRRKLEEIEQQRRLETEQQQVVNLNEPDAEESSGFGFGDFDFDSELDQLQSANVPEKKIFKTDVDEQIAADDMESHYNLGIAYREMGLLDDAISEFEKAQKDPLRYVDCQMLKGLSYSDKGDYQSAEMMFQQALDSSRLEEIQRLNLGYELGLLYERAGRREDALVSYRNVLSQDSKYRDVTEKVAELTKLLGIAADQSAPVAKNEVKTDAQGKRERVSFL